MNKLIHVGTLALIVNLGFGQTDTYLLNQNNASAMIANNGVFFNNIGPSQPGYEIPAGSDNHLICAMSFWFAGEDINGQVKMAGQTYTGNGDFFPGALTNDGTATAPVPAQNKAIYPVLKSEIDYHIAHFGDIGYVIPPSILEWPAHGNVSLDIDYYLAPFEDVNGDQVYNPADGDYPLIKGDEAVYMIMNDKAAVHDSGGDPIGLEIHYLFFQYNTADYFNDITFLNMKVINRGTQTLYNFSTGCFVDPDIGSSADDFAGYSANGNVMFAYNADNNDSDYGVDPPALGITLLNQDATGFNTFGETGPTALPTTPLGHYYNLQGTWNDGTSFTFGGNGYGGAVPTSFLYDGNPNNSAEWSELSAGNIGGERRMLLSVESDILSPSEELCFDYAFIYNRAGNNLQNVQGVIDAAVALNTWYTNTGESYCEAGWGLGLEETGDQVSVYPNPTNDGFYVNAAGTYDLEFFTIEGRLVYSEINVSGQTYVRTDLEKGVYLLVINQGEKKYQHKILIE